MQFPIYCDAVNIYFSQQIYWKIIINVHFWFIYSLEQRCTVKKSAKLRLNLNPCPICFLKLRSPRVECFPDLIGILLLILFAFNFNFYLISYFQQVLFVFEGGDLCFFVHFVRVLSSFFTFFYLQQVLFVFEGEIYAASPTVENGRSVTHTDYHPSDFVFFLFYLIFYLLDFL